MVKNVIMSVFLIFGLMFGSVSEAKAKSHGKKSHVSRVDKKKQKKKVIAKAHKKQKREVASVKKDKKKKKKSKKKSKHHDGY